MASIIFSKSTERFYMYLIANILGFLDEQSFVLSIYSILIPGHRHLKAHYLKDHFKIFYLVDLF